MKFLLSLVLTAAFGYLLPAFLPWWSFVISSFFIAFFIRQKSWKSFGAGFAGLLILWGIYAAVLDSANNHILSLKVAQILPFGGSYVALIITTAIVGGLLSGLAALSGSYLNRDF